MYSLDTRIPAPWAAWVDLPDETNILDGRFLVPLKRRDACVQVAGINVYPKHVEKILSQHPAVKTCRVRLMRPEEGTRLKAFVVLQDGYTPADDGIVDEAKARIAKLN